MNGPSSVSDLAGATTPLTWQMAVLGLVVTGLIILWAIADAEDDPDEESENVYER